MSTPTTSLQILNDIRDTIGNLVVKHKALSEAETTTPADLKEIDKELGDCLNLLLSVDTGLSALMSNDFNIMLQNGNTLVLSIEDKIALITTSLNAFDEAKTTSLQALETEKQQSLSQFGQSTQTALNSFDEAITTAFQDLEAEKQQSLSQFGQSTQTALNALDEAKTTAFQDLENEKNQALQNIQTVKGDDGLSAYEVALENGFVGSESDWLASLKGLNGQNASLSDSGWLDLKPYLVNGWLEANVYYNIAYRKIGDVVFFKGLVKNGTSSEIFNNLPLSILPLNPMKLSVVSTSTNNDCSVTLFDTGVFSVLNYDTTYTGIACCYLVN